MKILTIALFLSLFLNPLTGDDNPSILLNPQDVPSFSEDGNPLTDLKVFHFIPPLAFSSDLELQQKIQKAIKSELEAIGQIVHLKENDMRGFGAGTILSIQIGGVLNWKNRQMPFSRVSLQVETSTTLTKTGVNAFAAIWAINTFLKGPLDSSNETEIVQAVESITKDFVKNYAFANKNKKLNAIFYTYY